MTAEQALAALGAGLAESGQTEEQLHDLGKLGATMGVLLLTAARKRAAALALDAQAAILRNEATAAENQAMAG